MEESVSRTESLEVSAGLHLAYSPTVPPSSNEVSLVACYNSSLLVLYYRSVWMSAPKPKYKT